jgi:hypothetical protein
MLSCDTWETGLIADVPGPVAVPCHGHDMERTYRDSRPPEVIPYEVAIAAAGRLKALADAERDHLAATRGTRAVAEAAHRPGGPTVKEIEALYIRLRDAPAEARQVAQRGSRPRRAPAFGWSG